MPLLWQAGLFKRRGAHTHPVHRPPLATACKGQEPPAVPGIWKKGSESMSKVRHYCANCREKGEEDDNVVHDMYGYWDIESQSWVAGDLPAAGPYCGTCGSEATETEEVKA